MKIIITATVLLIFVAFATASRAKLETTSKRSRQLEGRNEGGGIMDILRAFSNLLKKVIGVMDGTTSVDDLVQAIQGIAFSIEKVVNLQDVVYYIPFVGPYMAAIVGGIGTVLADSSMLGGLLSQILIGPSSS